MNDAPTAAPIVPIRLTVVSGLGRMLMKHDTDGVIYRWTGSLSSHLGGRWSPALPYEAAAFERAAAQRTAR